MSFSSGICYHSLFYTPRKRYSGNERKKPHHELLSKFSLIKGEFLSRQEDCPLLLKRKRVRMKRRWFPLSEHRALESRVGRDRKRKKKICAHCLRSAVAFPFLSVASLCSGRTCYFWLCACATTPLLCIKFHLYFSFYFLWHGS